MHPKTKMSLEMRPEVKVTVIQKQCVTLRNPKMYSHAKELRALRGYFGFSIMLKNKNCFSPISSYRLVYENNNQSVKVLNLFNLKHCYGNKMATKQAEIGHFGANLRHIVEKLTLRTSKYQNDILIDDENYHGTQHIKRFLGI